MLTGSTALYAQGVSYGKPAACIMYDLAYHLSQVRPAGRPSWLPVCAAGFCERLQHALVCRLSLTASSLSIPHLLPRPQETANMLWLALVGLTDHLVHNRIKGGCTASQQAACGGGLLMTCLGRPGQCLLPYLPQKRRIPLQSASVPVC